MKTGSRLWMVSDEISASTPTKPRTQIPAGIRGEVLSPESFMRRVLMSIARTNSRQSGRLGRASSGLIDGHACVASSRWNRVRVVESDSSQSCV